MPSLSGLDWAFGGALGKPSKDLLPSGCRSRTLNEVCGGLEISSSTFPEDLRRWKPFGNFIGIGEVFAEARLYSLA